MKLLLSDLVDAARHTTGRQRSAVGETELRAEAEALGARGAAGRFRAALEPPGVSVIAEVKGASPLRGPLRDPFVPTELAAEYEGNGAAALSVLTEEHFFAGSIDHLMAVSSSIELPTLRKDFVTELYQVFRAATAGASAVLLIAELLDGAALREFVAAAHSVGLDALVEFHRKELLLAAVESGSGIVGINNRNLDTMDIDFEHAVTLAPELPPDIVSVAESAIVGPADVARVAEAGFDAILVGTALVTADDPGAVLEELVDAGATAAQSVSAPPADPGPADPGVAAAEQQDDDDYPDIDFDGAMLL
jgi:indole-3-glycerol phosphate synthase